MNNLAQTESKTESSRGKELILSFMFADRAERRAVFNHINAFLQISRNAERVFWLKMRYTLERIAENVQGM